LTTRIITGDCRAALKEMADKSMHCCVTSPPYFRQRVYGMDGEIGHEQTPAEYVAVLVSLFREIRRVLRDDGTLWLNLGDSYARGFGGGSPGKKSATNVGSYAGRVLGRVPPGFNKKDLLMIPARVAIAMQEDGWILRSNIVWHKPNAMTESVLDRPATTHESIFMFSKAERYFYDLEATKIAGNNLRNVWSINTAPTSDKHFAQFPRGLVRTCILAGCPLGGTVLDPFGGSGTTGLVAGELQRDAVLIELNPEYAVLARRRITADAPLLAAS
jgi:DNA modification methylase